jgi:catechol 2,3-dioxygenase-like lactoylglutathione lyase family enzyme
MYSKSKRHLGAIAARRRAQYDWLVAPRPRASFEVVGGNKIVVAEEIDMRSAEIGRKSGTDCKRNGSIDMALEVAVIPVSDVERAKRFYGGLGWRLDLDFDSGTGYRVIQFTPSGSGCSVTFGKNVTSAAPGSVQGLHLIVSNIDTAREDLLRRGIAVSEPFHDAGGVFHRASPEGRAAGPNPQRKSYASYLSFSDPDGNRWVVQEVTARLSAEIKEGDTDFTSELVNAVLHPSNRSSLAAIPN